MITSTDNADVIITQADAKQRGGRGQGPGAPAAGGLIDLDDEGPVDSEAKESEPKEAVEPKEAEEVAEDEELEPDLPPPFLIYKLLLSMIQDGPTVTRCSGALKTASPWALSAPKVMGPSASDGEARVPWNPQYALNSGAVRTGPKNVSAEASRKEFHFETSREVEMGGWRGMEVHSVRSFLSPVDARELSDCLASADDYDTDADSVDSCPTFEFYPFQRGRWKNEALRTLLEDVVERRLLPYVRQRFGEERMALSEVLVRRYLPEERRTHAAHYDGHAFATAVLGLSDPSGYEGGLYLQPGPHVSSRRTVRLEPGDLLVHSFDLQHGVEVTQGSRYSLIFWLKDSPEAVATGTTPWYEKAAAAGEPDALYNLGIQRELGLHGQEIDLQKAKEAYLKSAELGHHFSQNNLALLYQEHPELDVDGRGSLHWMRLAAASGFAVAQKNLGTMLMEEPASRWLRRAAEQREPEAAFFLGESAALGFFLASTELGMCLGKGSSAAAIWQRLSDRGDAEAQFHLGTCFLRGSGVGVDEERALQLLQASCDAGSERAAALLQELDNVSDWAEPDQRVGITQASQELPEELSEIESSIEEDADRSYPEDFADDTGTGTLDRSEPRQSAAASPRSLTSDKEASYSEDFAEATLEATLEEALPAPDIPRATLDRRQEIALRQQADSKKMIVPLVPDEDDIEEEDIPEGGDFSEDNLEGSSSMYDPEVRRREMEKEEQQREEEERVRREQEQAEQARKQKEIDEANRRLAAERKRKLEEEKKREEEEAFRRKQQEELQREARRAEEQRKQEEAERKREEERRKAEEQEIRRREEERRKAEEEAKKREEEQRKKSEEENRRKEEERRQAEEETRQREERKKAEEETKKREEEERRKAEEETKKREEEEAERRKAEEELLKREEAMRVLPSQVQQAVTSEEPEELQNQEAKQMEAQVHELPDRPKQPVLEQLEPEVPRSSQKGPAKDSDVASSLTAAGRRPRRFSGAWIQTELEEGEKAAPGPEENRSHDAEPSGQTELFSGGPVAANVWSSPKSQWDEQRTASTTAGDRSYRTGWSSRWEHADTASEWQDRGDWRGAWWHRDWHLQRDEEDFRPFEVRSQGRERWGSLGEDLPTWSQRRSRDLWPETPSPWEKESWPRQADKENCLSQLGDWDWERVRRSPSRASGLWQSRPKAAWEAAAASFPNQSVAPQPLGIAPGFYGQPTPFGVLYPWGFAGYPLPGPGPGPCVVAPPAVAESATLSPTGASPARPPPAEEEEAPAPPTVNLLETTLPVGPGDLDFQESLLCSFSAVVDEMLQFKYGCGIDTADYRAKLRVLCDASALCSMPRLVDAANSQKEFFALDASNCQVQLRLTYQELSSFGALCERLRMLPGTASAVVVISTRGGYAVQALAAFRPSCDLRHAVGRCGSGPGARALEHFAEE
ncbi:unnamed protein product, partial [Symbiodinium microadriaticum]